MKCPHCNNEVTLVAGTPTIRVGEDPQVAALRKILEEKQRKYMEAQPPAQLPQWLRIGEIT